MLKALDPITKEYVLAWYFNSRKDLLAAHSKLVCPITKTEVFPRFRKGFTPHFVSKVKLDEKWWANESQEHIELKKQLFDHALALFDTDNFSVSIEYPIYIDNEIKRIADVMVCYYNEPYIAFEIQLSRITLDALKERIKDYESQGIDSYWIFGEKANTPEIEEFCINYFGISISTATESEVFRQDFRDYF